MDIPVLIEGERGCGYRKAGGLYLIGGPLSETCPKLPIKLDVCPTCHGGIKPQRGFQYVDGRALCTPEVHGGGSHLLSCPLGGAWVESLGFIPNANLTKAGLIWVGEKFYATPSEFLREGARLGISRRISAMPRDFEIGKTWVLLAHRKGMPNAQFHHRFEGIVNGEPTRDGTCARLATVEDASGYARDEHCDEPEEAALHREFTSAIFTLFRPHAVEYVVKGDETEEELEKLVKRGIRPVKVEKAQLELAGMEDDD